MRVFVFVNRVQEIGGRQTTALLIAALHRLRHEVLLANVDDLSVFTSSEYRPEAQANDSAANQSFLAKTIRLKIPTAMFTSQHVEDFVHTAEEAKFETTKIQPDDVILIRTNPGRDLERSAKHAAFLEICQLANASGVRVINDPTKLAFFASKAAVAILPEKFCPRMVVASEIDTIVSFITDSNCDCVVKSLVGTRGNNVIRINQAFPNIHQHLVEQFEGQCLVAQHFIESSEPGDKRVVVLNGQLMEHNKYIAGIHRHPAEGEFRANLHTGGTAKPLTLTLEQREAVLVAAEILLQAGIPFAGIDLIDTKVIEFNVFSTGGLYDANRFAEYDFAEDIANSLAKEKS